MGLFSISLRKKEEHQKLLEKVAQLEMTLIQTNKTLSEKRKSNKQYKEIQSYLKTRILELTNENAEKINEINKLNSDSITDNKKLDNLKQEVELLSEKNNKLDLACKRCQTRVKTTKLKQRELAESLQRLQADEQRKATRLKVLKNISNSSEVLITRKNRLKDNIIHKLQKLNYDNVQYIKKIRLQSNEIESLNNQLNNQKASYQKVEEERTKLSEKLIIQENKIKDNLSSLELKKKSLSEKTAKLESERQLSNKLTDENTAIEKHISNINNNLISTTNLIASIQSNNTELFFINKKHKESLKALEYKSKKLKRKLKRAKMESTIIGYENDELKDRLQIITKDNETFSNDFKLLELKISELNREKSDLNNNLAQCRHKLAVLKNKKEQMQAKLEQANTSLQKSHELLLEYLKRIDSTNDDIVIANKVIFDRNNKIKALNKKIVHKKSELKSVLNLRNHKIAQADAIKKSFEQKQNLKEQEKEYLNLKRLEYLLAKQFFDAHFEYNPQIIAFLDQNMSITNGLVQFFQNLSRSFQDVHWIEMDIESNKVNSVTLNIVIHGKPRSDFNRYELIFKRIPNIVYASNKYENEVVIGLKCHQTTNLKGIQNAQP